MGARNAVPYVVLKNGERRYRARWKDANGKWREKKTFKTAASALTYQRQMERQVESGLSGSPEAGTVRFDRWIHEWQAARTEKDSTLASDWSLATNHILPRFGDLQLRNIRAVDIDDWVQGLLAGEQLSRSSVNRLVSILQRALRRAVKAGEIPVNPASEVERGSAPGRISRSREPLSLDEVYALAEAIDLRYRAWVLVAALAGLRPSEACGLTVQTLDLLRRQVSIEAIVTDGGGPLRWELPKKRETRQVPIPQILAEELAIHIDRHPPVTATLVSGRGESRKFSGLIFSSPGGDGPMRLGNFRRREWRKAIQVLDRPVTPYELRHTFASVLGHTGFAAHQVAPLMGNSPRVASEVYTKLMPGAGTEVAAALGELVQDSVVGTGWARDERREEREAS